jgi:hypothetical protein
MNKITLKADKKLNLLNQNTYVISRRVQAIPGLFKIHGC